ncbi:MAG: hypothetical protein IIB77_04660, partial [Proteobacteria bacterium]|nr:hypothetical protein [Pseudomonadota bacterium]
RATAKVIGCWVTNFSLNGINIVAQVGLGGAIEGNANLWSLEEVGSNDNGRHGVFVDLHDTNAGCGQKVNCKSNGRWGIYDGSFLGCTWLACHTSANGLALNANNDSDESSFVSFGSNRYSANVGASEADLVATEPGTDETKWIFHKSGGVTSAIPLWVAAKDAGGQESTGACYLNLEQPSKSKLASAHR